VTTLDRIQSALDEGQFETLEASDGMPFVRVARQHVPVVMQALRDSCGFETNTLVSCIDRHPKSPRFEVIYQFLSLEHNDRVRITVSVDDEAPSVASISALWPGANFSERECFDMFGIDFEGHPNLERLLMPKDYDHHPLRKEFPHRGIEPDRLYREWERQRHLTADQAR
jgi:NADH-quinone oxidoreductase subunit C